MRQTCSCSFLYDIVIHNGKGELNFDLFYNLIRSDNFIKTVSHFRRIKLETTWVRVVFTTPKESCTVCRSFRRRNDLDRLARYTEVFPMGPMYNVGDRFSFSVSEVPYVIGPLINGERIQTISYPFFSYSFVGGDCSFTASINIQFDYYGIESDMNPNYIVPREIIDGTAEPQFVLEGYSFYSQSSEKKIGTLKAIAYVDEEAKLDSEGYYIKQMPDGQFISSVKIRFSTLNAIDPPDENEMPEGMSWFKNSNGKQIFGQLKDLVSISKSDQEEDIFKKAVDYIGKNVIKRKPDDRVKEIGAKIFKRITTYAKMASPLGDGELAEPAWLTKIKNSEIVPKLTEVIKKAKAVGDQEKLVITAGEDEEMKQVEVTMGATTPFYYHQIEYWVKILGSFQPKYEPLDIRVMAPILSWPFSPPVLTNNSVCVVILQNATNTSHYMIVTRNILDKIERPSLDWTGEWGIILTDRDEKDKKPYDHQIRLKRSTTKILPNTQMYLCSCCVPDMMQTNIIEIPQWLFKYSAVQMENNLLNQNVTDIETIPIY